MARPTFMTPPSELREKLGPDGYEYILRLHEHLYQGGENGTGQLGIENLDAEIGEGDVKVLKGGADGKLQYKAMNLEETVAEQEGVVQVSGRKPQAGPLNAEKLTTDEQAARKSFRSTGSGKVAFVDGLETRAERAANFAPRTETPEPPTLDEDVTQYVKDGYLIYQHQTYSDKNEKDPVTGENLPPGERTRYVYRDMRDPRADFIASMHPPDEREKPEPAAQTEDVAPTYTPPAETYKSTAPTGRDHAKQLHTEIFS